MFSEEDLQKKYQTDSILEGLIHSTPFQVLIRLALPLVEVKIMTPKSADIEE